MATMTKPSKRRIVKGIEHGYTGYTMYACRCPVCTEANAEHARDYRARRFAGDPLCIRPGCAHIQTKARASGLCWRHDRALRQLLKRDRAKALRVAKRLGITLGST